MEAAAVAPAIGVQAEGQQEQAAQGAGALQEQGMQAAVAAAGAQQQQQQQSLLVTPIPESVARALVASVGDELSFLWGEYSVPVEIQARLIQLGVTEVNVFSKLESDEPGMRDFIREEVKLKAQEGMRTNVGRLLSALEAAHLRGAKRKQEGAEQRVYDLPRTLPKKSHLTMRQAFGKLHGAPDEKELPATCAIEKQLSQIEYGYLIAPRLSEVASILEVDEDDMGAAQIKADGTVNIKKTTKAEVPLPANTEQLRYRIKLLGHLWEMIRLHMPSTPSWST